MMKLNQNLFYGNSLADQILKDSVLPSFDVHLQQANLAVTQTLHGCAKAHHWNRNRLLAELTCGNHRMRDVIRSGRNVKNPFSIKISNPGIVKAEFIRELLGRKPFLHSGRRVKRVDSNAVLMDQREVKGDILANAQGIDNRVGSNPRRIEEITAVL